MDNQTTGQPFTSLDVLEMGPLGQCCTCRHWDLDFQLSDEDMERFRGMGVCNPYGTPNLPT